MSRYVMSARCEAYKNGFTLDLFFLCFEGTTTEEPATSPLSPAPSKILPLNVLRSTVIS